MDINEALKYLKRGDLKTGSKLLEKLYETDSQNPVILFNLGMVKSDLGELDESEKLLTKCVEKAPEHVDALTALGVLYARKGNLDRAEYSLKRSLEVEPDNIHALRNLSAIFGKAGRTDEAFQMAERAFKLDPTDLRTKYGYAYLLFLLKRFAEADPLFKELLQASLPADLEETIKHHRREIAGANLAKSGPRMDAVMYISSAIEKFSKLSTDEVRNISFEIAMLGRNGLDIHNPDSRYQLKALPGTFSAMQLVSMMYAGFKSIDPAADIGIDLSKEYEMALKLKSNQG